jgi:hypothetical protein
VVNSAHKLNININQADIVSSKQLVFIQFLMEESMKNISSMQNMTPATNTLNRKQLMVLISLGVFFWFVFAMLIRWGNSLGIFGGSIGAVTFLGSIPIGWILILGIKAMVGLAPGQIFAGLGISTATAGLCDGIALTWMPSLYGSESGSALLGAGYILWGAGVILFLAYVMDVVSLARLKETH